MSIILGIIIIVIGVVMAAKSEWLLSNFGRIGFFEQHLGTEGGSRLGYKLLGVVVIFIGLLLFTGMFSGFMNWLLGPLIRVSQPLNN